MTYDKEFFKKNILTKVTSKIKKYEIASFDTETHGYMNKLLLCGVVHDKKTQRKELNKNFYKVFLEREDAQQYIEEISKKDMYIVATNLNFDFQCLYYESYMWDKFKVIMRNGNLITAKYKNIKMIDTTNYTFSSVKKLGQAIGLQKLEYKEMMGKQPRTPNQWKKLQDYNRVDCVISKVWLEKFQDALNKLGCELKITIASCAMDLYRRKYIPINIYKEPIECKEFIMKGYYGGRVEVFKRGKLHRQQDDKTYYWLDYNSAYPYQMLKEYPLPSSAKMIYNATIDTIKNYHGTSEVTITAPYMRYPLLPCRIEDKLIFPYGKFRGVYNHIELQRAIELGYKIEEIHQTLYYTQTFYPFKDYVKDLYKLRMKYKQDNDAIMSEICKLLMNALYGKFGSKTMQEIEFYDLENMTEDEKQKLNDKGMFDGMQVTYGKDGVIRKGFNEHEKDCDQNYVIPILSSCVTSYQRVQIHKDLERLQGLYCDTDSILTLKKISNDMELGGLKLEKLVKKGWLIRPKCYMIFDETLNDKGQPKGWNVKVKGINGMTSERFYDILTHKNIGQFKFMKIKEALKQRYAPNQKKKFVKLQDLEDNKRVWSGKFDKNKLQDSSPIYINIDEDNLE